MADTEQLIRETAYRLWEEDGRPFGQAERHWEMAKKLTEDAEFVKPGTVATVQKKKRSPAKQNRRAA